MMGAIALALGYIIGALNRDKNTAATSTSVGAQNQPRHGFLFSIVIGLVVAVLAMWLLGVLITILVPVNP